MHVILLTHTLVEQSGGPAAVATGLFEACNQLGVPVTLVNLIGRTGDEVVLIPESNVLRWPATRRFLSAWSVRTAIQNAAARYPSERPIVWVNGIFGARSLAAYLSHAIDGFPIVVRPAGSLGLAALRHKALRKAIYFSLIERHGLRYVAGIHCMTQAELDELPASLKSKAFVAAAGVELPNVAQPPENSRNVIGVLARIHPIKRQHYALDVAEALLNEGIDLQVEFAGDEVDPTYARKLRQRVDSSPALVGKVTFLGHVRTKTVPSLVGRWTLAMLPSEQENFGHAVLVAASLGIPNVVSTGVGLANAVERFGAGCQASDPAGFISACRAIITGERRGYRDRALKFASSYSWPERAKEILHQLERRL